MHGDSAYWIKKLISPLLQFHEFQHRIDGKFDIISDI